MPGGLFTAGTSSVGYLEAAVVAGTVPGLLLLALQVVLLPSPVAFPWMSCWTCWIRRDIAASEFDLLRLALSWLRRHGAAAGVDLLQLVADIDFDKMKPEEVMRGSRCSLSLQCCVAGDLR